MIISAGETDKDALRKGINSVKQLNIPFLGVVLNGVTESNMEGSYYYYYQYYYYGDGDKRKKKRRGRGRKAY
jgi:Mrp family chromosome partitioning ATPase